MVGCWAAYSHDSRGNPPAASLPRSFRSNTTGHGLFCGDIHPPLDLRVHNCFANAVSACHDVVRSPSKVSAVVGLTVSADLSPDLSAPLH